MDLYHKLLSYENEGYYPMHMPGHKRNKSFSMVNPYSIDITEIDGFDNLHEPEEVLLEAMEHAATVFHAKQSFFLINGSTAGLLAGICAATKKGGCILIARNCHKSVYNAVYLNELKPIYLYPEPEPETGILMGIQPEVVEEMLQKHSEISLVVITSPTYEGVVSDVERIARIAHSHGVPLLVDEAHGAHLGFHKSFPKNSNMLGADLVIQSIHKTLPAFTQTALLHWNGNRICESELKKYLSIFQTSSPSYVLMAGMDSCIRYVEEHVEEFDRLMKNLTWFREQVKELENIRLWTPEVNKDCFGMDPSKLVLFSENEQLSGKILYDILRDDYKIQPEMVSRDYVLCMTSICDTVEGFERLAAALKQIDKDFTLICRKRKKRERKMPIVRPQIALLHHEMDGKKTVSCPWKESLNSVAAEFVYLYPPGIPVLVPGEIITGDILELLLDYKKEGLSLRGMQDKAGEVILVLD